MAQFWDTYTPDCKDCASYERQIADLKRQLAEARKDTERLNWILDRSCRMPIQSSDGYIVQEWVGRTTGRGKTQREAIDNAVEALRREAEKETNSVNYEQLEQSHPKLSRGQVWCIKCGTTRKVNSAWALRNGWPKCCGSTMTIDSPEERSVRLY